MKPGQPPPITALRERYAAYSQEHVFRFWDELDAAAQRRLASQAAGIDPAALADLHRATRVLHAPGGRRLEPAPIERLPEHGGDPLAHAGAVERGEQMLRDAAVAVVLVAGGQGTRLGFHGPKGAFPLGPVSGRTLFALQAQKIQRLRRRFAQPLPWYVMTSPATDAPTREYFLRQRFFGLPEAEVFFFQQSTVPALDFEGRLILERRDRIFESPNGHGGSLTALAESGALDDMEQRGVRTLFYYQVDNCLVRMADPRYLGFHAAGAAEMSCKVVSKTHADEKMGVVARVDGRVGIVEYTELDEAQGHARDARGELVYWAGSIGIHVLETGFVRRVAAEADRLLPYHASAKQIPCVDDRGRRVVPSEPNGNKLERFVFDALLAARRVVVVEAQREQEFAPLKNAEGEDSPATARAALEAEYRRWLGAAGLKLPAADRRIELDHARFDGPEDLTESGIRRLEQAADNIRTAPGESS